MKQEVHETDIPFTAEEEAELLRRLELLREQDRNGTLTRLTTEAEIREFHEAIKAQQA